MAKIYNVNNWYWFVGGDTTQAYSSASGTFVPVSNPALIAWGADGTTPTNIDTAANLGDVLGNAGIRPADATVLDGYKGSQAVGIIQHNGFKVLFNHENRIRAIERNLGLNGSPANLTAQQAVAAVKALM